jgi:dTDP-4-dehydrorhamnose 3,5-epimerase-like enzyme
MLKFNNIHLDDETMWPDNIRIELEKPHEDERGFIQPLVNFPMKNLSIIFSKKGSVRSNHNHYTDWHYMYVTSGAFDYYYRPHKSEQKPKVEKFEVGEMVFTPPMEDHACVFTEDTTLIVVSRNPRDQKTYESDVVRIELINPDDIIL